MIEINKTHKAFLTTNIIILLIFIPTFIKSLNFEFLVYVATILLYIFLIGISLKKIKYQNSTFIFLTIWSFLHMAGGGLTVNGTRLYDLMLIPIFNNLQILKYDQAVHVFGFFTATLLGFDLLKDYLKNNKKGMTLNIILVMVGMGFGALNEILEFLSGFFDGHEGVGGYMNTSLDLCFNFIGSVIAVFYINKKVIK